MVSLAQVVIVLAVFSFVAIVFAKEKVPVLVWTNDRSVEFPNQLVGHSIGQEDFRKSFVNQLIANDEDNVVLFVQDKLSISDFTHFSDIYDESKDLDSFANVKNLMSEMTSTYLPRVALPTAALMEVKHQKSRKVQEIDNPDDLVANNGSTFFIVKLPEAHHSHESLSRIDKMIGLMTSTLKSFSRPFVAFYTATKSGHQSSSLRSQSRRLMSTTASDGAFFINFTDSFFFYSSNISIGIPGNSEVVTIIEVNDTLTTCNITDNMCEIVLHINGTSLESPTLMFQFVKSPPLNAGYWYLSRMALMYKNATLDNDMNTVDYTTDFVDQTPFGYSYHCYKMPMITVKNTSGIDKGNAPIINFNNFQVQAFGIKNDKFGHYNDCIGFFTIGIWMFLITAIILLSVLFYGVIMTMNLTTMDRFDDAKGKTITVNVSD